VRLEELDFEVPQGLIAQRPAEPRDSCRLMYLDAQGGAHHGRFVDLPAYLRPGDTLVLNDSRVLPARLQVTKRTGGVVELLFLRPMDGLSSGFGEVWEVLARPSHRLRPATALTLPSGQTLILRELLGDGRWLLEGPPRVSVVGLFRCLRTSRPIPTIPPHTKRSTPRRPARPRRPRRAFTSPLSYWSACGARGCVRLLLPCT
jgi:S-adenosylmethionine:tRNA-ribosyltransferase-isomerase (queuine synthetase)